MKKNKIDSLKIKKTYKFGWWNKQLYFPYAGQSYNFDKSKYNEMDNFGQPYDYLSIMHYTRTSWTKNGKDTLQAKSDPNLKLGGDGLSKYDIAKINAMYHCHGKFSLFVLSKQWLA